MIKIIFFDIDGTLRGFEEKGIRPSVYEAIALAKSNGIKCFVATGRHKLEILEEKLLGDLEFDGYIYLNGSYCADADGNILYHTPIHPSQIQKMIDLTHEIDFSLLLQEVDKMYIDRVTPLVARINKSVGTRLPPVIPDLRPFADKCIYQAVIFGEMDDLNRVVAQIPLCNAVHWGSEYALDITPAGGDKCIGIAKVLESLGLAMDEAAAIGDSHNDIEMIKAAGFGIAMGNACPEAKDAAKFIAPHVDDDGLLAAVKRILQENTRGLCPLDSRLGD